MVLEDIPTPITLLFGGYVIGAGYLALLSFFHEGVKEMSEFDKLMFSLVFGMLGFMLVINAFQINVNFTDVDSITRFFGVSSLFVFFVNVYVSRTLMQIWGFMEKYFLGMQP